MWSKFKPVFEFIGVVQLFWGLYGIFFGTDGLIHQNWSITYDFLYGGMLSVGLSTILYISFRLRTYFLTKWRENFNIEPDISIKDAIEYIIEYSRFGTSIQENQDGREDVISSIKNLLLKGDIKLFGTSRNNPLLHKINKKELNEQNLEIIYTFDNRYSFIHGAFIADNDKKEKFKNLMISKKQLMKKFPSRY